MVPDWLFFYGIFGVIFAVLFAATSDQKCDLFQFIFIMVFWPVWVYFMLIAGVVAVVIKVCRRARDKST